MTKKEKFYRIERKSKFLSLFNSNFLTKFNPPPFFVDKTEKKVVAKKHSSLFSRSLSNK